MKHFTRLSERIEEIRWLLQIETDDGRIYQLEKELTELNETLIRSEVIQ